MKRNYTFPILLFFTLSLFAQVEKDPCGAISYSSAYLAEHPDEEEKLLELEMITQQWIEENKNAASSREIITIPVVVHIVVDLSKYNFQYYEIQSQIDGLTADFRKQNSNQSIIPDEFKDRAADVEIEFCLASIDPFGQKTDGVQIRNTSIENFGESKINGLKRKICYFEEGGFDAWDPEHYLNIWVGEMESILGEATFPEMARVPEEEGVWIDTDAFAYFCSDVSDFHLGRTLTHEVGHYFNLKHIFGDSEDCLSDDGVADTPAQEKRNINCPEYPKINVCDSLEPHEMTVNFMDYVDDECMAMFTEGQKMRMLAALNTTRQGLKNSIGCNGLEENTTTTLVRDSITVFPNPASDCIHVDLDIDTDYEIRMEMINTAGQRLFSQRVDAKDIRSIDVSYLPNGIYFILFENGSNFASKKIIIDK